MFSPALGRVIRSTTGIPLSSTAACSIKRSVIVAASSLQQHTLAPPPLPQLPQRRFSSSKTSFPPDSSNPSAENPTTSKAPTRKSSTSKASKGQTAANESSASKASTRKATTKAVRKKAVPFIPQYNIPSVPITEHTGARDIQECSFYGLHRPLSTMIANVFDRTTTEQFNSILEPENPNTLFSDKVFNGLVHEEDAVQKYEQNSEIWSYLKVKARPEGGVIDLPPPFFIPPVPTPYSQLAQSETGSNQQKVEAPAQKSSWVLTETVDPLGNRILLASFEPPEEISEPMENTQETADAEIRQPSLGRLRRRQSTVSRIRDTQKRPDMLAISVKRQRKLKMKKHKYKKLMKRTRLLRRKLDRL